MKGIIFTEFLDLVERKFGLEVVDEMLNSSNLESGGIYTAVGTYSFSEMLQLLNYLSNTTKISIDDLLLLYGEHFFSKLEEDYGELLGIYSEPIEMLSSIESHIHVEVQKIYPEAELPIFDVIEKTEDSLVLVYKSSRAMHHFGLGLMNKTFEYFNAKASIVLEKLNEEGTEVRFVINQS
ncbi:MAG: heme NO-binding domain-containing protein [Jejuia sp.]